MTIPSCSIASHTIPEFVLGLLNVDMHHHATLLTKLTNLLESLFAVEIGRVRTHAIMDVGVWMSGGFENGTGLEVRKLHLVLGEEKMKISIN